MGKAKPGKQKTKSAATKRFKLTGSGKIIQAKAGKSHLLSSKNDRQLKVSRLGVVTDKGNQKNVKRMLSA